MKQVVLTRAGFPREASAIDFIVSISQETRACLVCRETIKKAGEGQGKSLQHSCHCQRNFILPKDSFWNMKRPQACRPRTVCLAPVLCQAQDELRRIHSGWACWLRGRQLQGPASLDHFRLYTGGRATLSCCRSMTPPAPIFSICHLHFHQDCLNTHIS